MTDLIMPFAVTTLTANGGANGIITVTSTTGFRKGARVLLGSSAVDAVELVVDQVIDATHLAVRDPSVTGTCRYNCSAYLTADTAKVTQNEQPDFYGRQFTWF